MIRLVATLLAGMLATPVLSDPQSFPLTSGPDGLGGLSAVELSADGARIWLLSDQGWIFEGHVSRTNGAISAVTLGERQLLRRPDGRALGSAQSDSEGLASDPNGGFWVSFEGPARVWHYDSAGAVPVPMPDGPGFAEMQQNSALEALAAGPDGALYTLPERSGRLTRPFPVLRFRNGSWSRAFDISRRGNYLAVGADIGPDGRLYLLERDVLGITFRSRIRRFALDGSGEATLWESGFGDFDNLEGISVWQGPSGLRATMVSDDNFLFLQQTQLVEVDLPG